MAGRTAPLVGYLLRRLLQAVPLLLGIATITFLLLHMAPGDPTAAYFNPNVPAEVVEAMRRNLGLDEPLHVQYLKWLGSFLTGDFGYSFSQHRPVAAAIGEALPNTLVLSGVSLVLIFVLGCAVGVVQALRQYSALDSGLTFGALFVYSMPNFWLGLVLILLASAAWMPEALQLPISGMTSLGHDAMGFWEGLADRARHLVLPSIALGAASAAGISRYMRGAMLEVVDQDYVRTARAKGLSRTRVVLRHAVRNALLPVVSLLGLYLPLLFGGAVVIEVVFSWPGMGRLLYNGILARDYPLVMAATFLFGGMVVAGNLLADLLYAAVDPRVRYDG